ncbi:DNA translocase FtsK [Ammoniphilus sp. YIM 78166]|uniref:DNA translocase FtsK n=1 Tax=Ammoniphilus sp. YIM 78166 TaxID=1644106 RepID=UPI0035120EA2
MKKWWKKISDAFGSNNEEPDLETAHHEKEPIAERFRPEVQVRTRTIYPKGAPGASPFRFPMIPDEVRFQEPRVAPIPSTARPAQPVPAEPPRRMAERRPVQHQPKKATEPRPAPAQAPAPSKEKVSFKPTVIVSPIYGTMKTEQSTSRTMDGFIHTGKREMQVEPPQAPDTPSLRTSNEPVTQSLPVAQPIPVTNSKKDEVPEVKVLKVEPPQAEPVLAITEVEVQAVTFEVEKEAHTPTQPFNPVVSIPQAQPQPVMIPMEKTIVEPTVIEPPASIQAIPQALTYFKQNQEIPVESHQPTAPATFYSSTGARPVPPAASITETYQLPHFHLLRKEPPQQGDDDGFTDEQIEKLTVALENFHVSADVIGVVKGPTVTRYELQPAPGVKVNKFTNLIDDIKLALAAKDIRMEAPIPGRSAIGIEVPNEKAAPVFIRSILESEEFRSNPSPLAVALGKDIGGMPIVGDLKKMPHGLIAGSTGSGKSVCINSILVSLMYKAKPSEVRLILIDPKVVELAPYNHIPHLLTPVVTDPKQATAALRWAVEEMDGRYEKFADKGARDIERYNQLAQQEGLEKLPYIVIIIDELADLMMVAPGDVEEAICRIAQKARACGIHLLVATQRPSVDVITGLIKANIPSRIAFAVSSGADSRTILDMGGAERLLGKGDMLYYPSGMAKPVRLQGNFVSDDEIESIVDHVKKQQKVQYVFDKEELSRAVHSSSDNEDELFEDALLFVVEQGQASASSLQRRFRIGYNRAARLIDMMEAEGFISGQSGSKAREVLITEEDYRNMFG